VDHTDYCDFLDTLYDAALESALWTPVMERLIDLVGGNSAWLSELNIIDGGGSYGMIARLDPAMPDRYLEYYAPRNPLSKVTNPSAYLRNWAPRVLTDEDWMPKGDLVRTEFYNDFMATQDVHSVLMVRLAKQGSDTCVLNLFRAKAIGQFSRPEMDLLGRLHPHLIRAFRLSQKLAGIQQVKEGMAYALDRTPHGIFLIDGTGVVRHANRVGESLVAEAGGLRVVAGQLTAATQDAARRLHGLIASASCLDRERRTGGSMAVPSPLRRTPLSVTVAPLRSERFDFLRNRMAAIVCVADPEAGTSLPQETLQNLFGLTPAEARVAMAVFEGLTSREAAENLGLSFHTVRVQLARIFEKTQVNRQSELVRLMMGAVGAEME
jgi:DNA-binding CsgD family transcriptional regulator